jgi:hypothetical protein
MTDLPWSAALFWYAMGSGLTLLAIGTRRRKKRRNRRVGLPAPVNQRAPRFDGYVVSEGRDRARIEPSASMGGRGPGTSTGELTPSIRCPVRQPAALQRAFPTPSIFRRRGE